MSLIIIPKDPSTASAQFREAIDEPVTVLYVVYGEDQDTPRRLQLGLAFAAVFPEIRRTVWVADPAALDDALRRAYLPKGYVAVSIGYRDKVAAKLTAAQSLAKFDVRAAYTAAELQK